MKYLGRGQDLIDRCFRIPRVIVFTGHMVDRPGRATPRFLAETAPAVSHAIRERIQRLGAWIGYASAACGADTLFLEAIQKLDGEAHVVLPYGEQEFIEASVEIVPGADWGPRCRQVLRRAAEVVMASEQPLRLGGVSYDDANLLLLGLAGVRANAWTPR